MARDRKNDDHRKQTEREVGRKLGPNEVVDHVDEDKENSSKANRRIMSRSEHTKHHNRRRVTGQLKRALSMVKRGEKLF